MTVSTLRPDGTVANTGSVTGAASAHAALSDDSDSSYVTLDPASTEQVEVTVGDLTLPAGAVISAATIRVRVARVASTNSLRAELRPSDYALGEPQRFAWASVTWATATTVTALTATAEIVTGQPFTDADIDGMNLHFTGLTAAALVLYEAYLDVIYVERPVVSVDEPSTSPITDTNRPTVAWSNTLDSDGGPQTRYEVRVFTDAQYGAGGFDPATSTAFDESGIVSSAATSWQGDALLADDTYRAYVRVAQTVNGELHWSDWDYVEFEVDVDLPAVPSMTLTAITGGIEIDLSDNTGDATTDYLEVQRSIDGGTTWATIRTRHADGLIEPDGSGDATVYDYEAPEGVTVTYRARAAHDYSGVLAYSAWSATDTVEWASTSAWVKHPLLPALNVEVTVRSIGETQRTGRQGVHQPLGATHPIVISDTRGAAQGVVTVRTDNQATRDKLDALLNTTDTLLLQFPAAYGEPDRYVRILSHTLARAGDRATLPHRFEPLTWVQVAAPTGVVQEWPA